VFKGDLALFDPDGINLVAPERHGHVTAAQGQAFLGRITSDAGAGGMRMFHGWW